MNYEYAPLWKVKVSPNVIINRKSFEELHRYIVYNDEGHELRFASYACARSTAVQFRKEEIFDDREKVRYSIFGRWT